MRLLAEASTTLARITASKRFDLVDSPGQTLSADHVAE